MTNVNYDREMQNIIDGFDGKKPRLLLHACCAPCASACIERLKEYFDVTVYFYNPNMDTEEEYFKRAEELEKLCGALSIKVHISNFCAREFLESVAGLEKCQEGGARCQRCFALRLKNTAQKAKAEGYDYFTTTLTISPLKNAEVLNCTGKSIGEETGIAYLPSDFKKRSGYQRSIQMSNEYGLYRQNYCGCVFSKNSN